MLEAVIIIILCQNFINLLFSSVLSNSILKLYVGGKNINVDEVITEAKGEGNDTMTWDLSEVGTESSAASLESEGLEETEALNLEESDSGFSEADKGGFGRFRVNNSVTEGVSDSIEEVDEEDISGAGEDEGPQAEALIQARVPVQCYSGGLEGTCYTRDECFRRGGSPFNQCGLNFYCCVFVHTCGSASSENVTYFRSVDFPSMSQGTLACDYDIIIRSTTCALRVDFEAVFLARRLAGVCDVDQIVILNCVDGPTAGQCGPLSGYSTTVAVKPGQKKPVKLAVLIQNTEPYLWDIKITQIPCYQLKHFKPPARCGEVRNKVFVSPASSYNSPEYFDLLYMYPQHLWKNDEQPVWWDYPEPSFNTFYYGSTKRHLKEEARGSRRSQRRIMGGSNALLGEFPWVAAITLGEKFLCGGALINENYVLTAAHCLLARDTPIGELLLHLGDLDLMRSNETVDVVSRVHRVLYHSHFHPFLLSNDIALLQLDRPVLFSKTIQPACLPKPGDSWTGKKGMVVGWGMTEYPMGHPSPMLQKLKVKTLSNFQCSKMIEEPVSLGMLCAAPTSLQGTCFGDSGGPLTVETKDRRNVLIGVVSFGITGCAVMPAFPDIYTRVGEYIKWIEVNAM